MNKLNFFGVGPKIGIILIPWLVVTIVVSLFTEIFNFATERSSYLTLAGTILLIVGLIFYFTSVRLLLKGLKEQRLVTNWTFSLCQNPLYVSLILIVFPALSLLLNSWLVLTSGVLGYILFKIFIKGEYQELEKFFGEEYLKYKSETPEFFPLPIKKWMRIK